jgi:hypothetical protein
MTHEQKIRYMEIATSIVGFKFRKENLDMMVSLYDLVCEKEGKTDLDSVNTVQYEVEKRHLNMAENKTENKQTTEETNS